MVSKKKKWGMNRISTYCGSEKKIVYYEYAMHFSNFFLSSTLNLHAFLTYHKDLVG